MVVANLSFQGCPAPSTGHPRFTCHIPSIPGTHGRPPTGQVVAVLCCPGNSCHGDNDANYVTSDIRREVSYCLLQCTQIARRGFVVKVIFVDFSPLILLLASSPGPLNFNRGPGDEARSSINGDPT